MAASIESNYKFYENNVSYRFKSDIRKYYEKEDLLITDYSIDDMPDEFSLYYGHYDEWHFICRILDIEVHSDEGEILVLDGNGQGIWEDSLNTLMKYLNGKLDPDSLYEDEVMDIYIPRNVYLDRFSDFDKKYELVNKELFNMLYRLRALNIRSTRCE